MAKVSTATIRLVQKLNRKNKNGEFPIYIVVCFNGRLEKASGVSCLPKFWDGKHEVIKSSAPNAAVLNKTLNEIKNRLIEARNAFEYEGRVYSPSMLFDAVRAPKTELKNDYKGLYERLMDERRLSRNSRGRYLFAFHKLVDYFGRENFIIDELGLSFCKDFGKWLTKSISESSCRDIFGCICSVWHYAIAKRVVSSVEFPFNEFRYTQIYKRGNRDYCIDLINIRKLKEYFLDLVVVRNGNRWKYKDGALDRLHKRTSKEFALCWFLAMFYYNGSAPIDVAKLKVSDCSRVMIDGVDYWKLEFKRKKTQTSVSVRLKRDMFSIILLEHFLGYSKNGYVYPVLDVFDEDKMTEQSGNFGSVALKWVREAFQEINEATIVKNATEDCNEPLVEIDKVVLYSARHSFACAYLNSTGSSVRGLASLLSRSPNTISTYIHVLTHDKDIADAVSFLQD